MAESPFFSIVMPVYRTLPYLEEAVGGILAQTAADWELILVDDASPDGSGELCDNLAKRDGRISVLHFPENRGLSAARNAGLERASGRYLMFMDSDDAVEPELLEEVRRSLEQHPAQVVVFGLAEENFDARGTLRCRREVLPPAGNLNSAEAVRAEVIRLEQATLLGYAWNKFYDRALIEAWGLRFETVTLIEDIAFNAAFFARVHSMNTLPLPLYRYARRLEGSLTHRFVPDYFALHTRRVQLLYDLYDSWSLLNGEVKTALGGVYLRYILSALQQNCDSRSRLSHAQRRQWLRQLFDSPLYQELRPFIRAEGRVMKLLARPLLAERTAACLFEARVLYFVKNSFPVLFSRLKYRR